MQVVSSKWTLSLKLLLPAFLLSFGAAGLIIFFTLPLDGIGEPFSPLTAKFLFFSFYVSATGLYYIIFGSIKWAALDTEKLYISNFLKSFQYTYDSIAKVEEKKILVWNKVTVHFHEPGEFGSNVVFFSSYFWHYYLKKHPNILKQLLQK
ncbi:hypothetical protein OAK19_01270 [Aureispira]|nr:hypothetical protein [Aureispira sp.]